MKKEVPDIDFLSLSWEERLKKILEFFSSVVFSTSFSVEDQVILHIIFKESLPIEVFTLDTGRLFPETYEVWQRTLDRYKIPILVYTPPQKELQELLSKKGPFSFYESIENRKECCYIRKVLPLKEALKGKDLWISGLRWEHSPERAHLPFYEWDGRFSIGKFYPILDAKWEDLWEYVKKYKIPYNTLYDRGFYSIGCAPCTRAIKEGEDFRAGRWWWEKEGKKECGLHFLYEKEGKNALS